MFKLFTLEGATKMIPIVDARLQDLQSAIADLQHARSAARGHGGDPVETLNARQELAFLFRAVHDARREVERLGVQVPDVQTGVVEFPSRLGGEVVHLVWEPGHDAITHFHRLTGSDEVRPLGREADPGGHEPLAGDT